MLQRFTLLLGIFVVMALSNAVVPVLPDFAEGAALQGAVYSAYFLGAFVAVLPAGYASDRIGSVTLIRAGLLLTLASGILLILSPFGLPLILCRVIEGIGGGIFLSATLAWTNSQPSGARESGYVMAALNLGLVVGLLAAGWLDSVFENHLAGIAVFTALAVPATAMSVAVREGERAGFVRADAGGIVRNYFWLFVAVMILVGVTGAVAAIYPGYTGNDSTVIALQLATINIATVGAVLVAPRFNFRSVPAIRASALLMAPAVAAGCVTPYAFPVIGALSGVTIVAVLAFLAETGIQQGVMTGLFNTASYAGFTILSALAGGVAGWFGFLPAFLLLAVMVAAAAVPIGRCRCEYRG